MVLSLGQHQRSVPYVDLHRGPCFVAARTVQASILRGYCDPGESLMAYAWATQAERSYRLAGLLVVVYCKIPSPCLTVTDLLDFQAFRSQ